MMTRLQIVSALLLAGCMPKGPPPAWAPLDPTAEIVCPVPRAVPVKDASPLSWESAIYVDTDGKRGAERMIRVQAGRVWSVANQATPGQHTIMIADGKIDPEGLLVGLPAEAFADAVNVWTVGACTIAGLGMPQGLPPQ